MENAESLDSPEEAAHVRPGSEWGRFGGRLSQLLFRPSEFWATVRREEISIREMMFPHLVILVGARALAGLIGDLLGGEVALRAALGASITGFVSWFAMVWAFAIIAGSVAGTGGGRLSVFDSIRFGVYGLTPLFVVGMLGAIPFPHVAPIADLVAMPWAFYVMSVGIVPVLRIPPERGPGAAGQLCGALLILWTIMPTLLPQLVATLVQ